MPSRPKISDDTIEKVEEWIQQNEETKITDINKAIEYLVEKGLKFESKALTQKQIEEVEKLIEEKLD